MALDLAEQRYGNPGVCTGDANKMQMETPEGALGKLKDWKQRRLWS